MVTQSLTPEATKSITDSQPNLSFANAGADKSQDNIKEKKKETWIRLIQ